MTATDQLKEEHEAIKLMLEILEEICLRLENGKQVNHNHLKQILEFIQVFGDKCHHHKEEDLLFPALEKAGIPKHGGPIGMMLIEHDQGREYVRNMAQAVTEQNISQIIENARNYIAILNDHIDKENNILYMMADMHLSEEQQKELLKGFKKIETEKIGPGKHKKFHHLLHHLKGIYLGKGN